MPEMLCAVCGKPAAPAHLHGFYFCKKHLLELGPAMDELEERERLAPNRDDVAEWVRKRTAH